MHVLLLFLWPSKSQACGPRYTFFVNSENHAQLSIDDTRIIDSHNVESLTETSATTSIAPGQRSLTLAYVYKSRRALALAVTIQVSRYRNSNFRPLAGQFWLGKCGCTTVHKSVLVTFLVHFQGILVIETRSPCFFRSCLARRVVPRRGERSRSH